MDPRAESTSRWIPLPQRPPFFLPRHSASVPRSMGSAESKSSEQESGNGDRETGGNGYPLDPYARPFVPRALTSINRLPGYQIDTPPLRNFNFDTYVPRHVGLEFLPPIPLPLGIHVTEEFTLVDEAFHSHYAPYFQFHIEAEKQAQEKENESYALYEHNATLLSLQENEEATCCFHVPGVRENSPYLEEDDVVQFRQLTYESQLHKGLWILNTPVLATSRHQNTQPQQPHWSGTILNGRITVIQRKQELVSVRILGLNSHQLVLDMLSSKTKQVPCKFNIQFPLMKERYLPMQQVLPLVQWALRQDSWNYQQTAQGTALTPGLTNSQSPLPYSLTTSRRNWLLSMLCPTEIDCAIQAKLNPGSFNCQFFDTELNWEQKKATQSVCSRDYGTIPFLISGPPGTGKTKTLVEIALQLMRNEKSHILFCAPSEPAADILVQRLSIFCKPGELLRLNRTSRTFAEVPNTILPFCCILGSAFSVPPFRQLMGYKIVVASVRDTSMLMYARVTNTDLYAHEYGLRNAIHPQDEKPDQVKLHWTALLMDEAAQGLEPEALVPLSIVAPPLGALNLAITPILVMAGDEYQLGPRVALRTSPLRNSLFARLFARPVYANHPLARSKAGNEPPALSSSMLPILRPPFANLIRNYRSHPAILAIPSALFYSDTLEPHAVEIDRLESWDGWQGKGWPVLFYNSSGEAEDELEVDGGGWYNNVEAQLACTYAFNLVRSGLVQQHEVCIMSPFKAQVKRIRDLIRGPRFGLMNNVDIGPTEAFQGLERGIVILCTTRSKERFVKRDQELDWGIVGMPNKLNVALTRAKFGLIVIGKLEILEMDEYWRSFLRFCKRNELWDGKKSDGAKVEEGKRTRLERVLLYGDESEERLREEKALKVWGRAQEDPMWIDGVQAELDDMGSSEGEDGEDEQQDNAVFYDDLFDLDNAAAGVEDGQNSEEEEYQYHESLTGLGGHL